MTKVDLSKIEKYALIGFGAAALLFTVGAWERIVGVPFPGVSFAVIYFPILAVFGLLLLLYCRRMRRCEKNGQKCLGLVFLNNIHKYRFLIEQLVIRDFKIKYKRSVLGVFWSFLNPLLMMVVQYIVFSHLLNVRGDVQHYAIYLLCGIVIWNGFNDCAQQAMRSITGNAALITKVYVPKYIYPVTKVLSASVNVALSMIPLVLVTVIYGLFSTPNLYLSKAVLLIPFGFVFLITFSIGIGFLLSALMVFFHDIEFLWSVISTIWMYATPIIYALSMFEDKAAWIVKVMQFNPLYHYITFFRTILLERTSPAFSEYLICIGFSAAMLLIGYAVFKKSEDKFILYL